MISMSEEEVRAYLRAQHKLILVSQGPAIYPHPMPMNYVFDDHEQFLMTTFRKSQKVLNLQRNPKASLLVESGVGYDELKSVLAYASGEIIDDAEEVMRVMDLMLAKDSAIVGENAQGLGDQAEAMAAKRVVLRFTPDRYISWDHGKLGGRY